MKNLKFIIGGAIFLIAFLFLNPFGYNNSTERVVIQPVNGELDVQFNPGLYYAGFFAKTYTYPNNVTIQCGPEEKKSDDADHWVPFHSGTFAEGDQADLGHTVKWDLPNTKAEMIELHTTYNDINNLMTTTLTQYQKETASYSTQRMTSEAHYSGGQSQLKDYFQDQLRKGQVLLVTSTKTETLKDGSTKTFIEVNEKTDANGDFLRTISDIQKYNLYASFASIDYVKYNPRIYEKLEDKIDAAADEATSKQRLITAQQEEQEAIVRGRKLIAERTATEEAAEIEAFIRARKERKVAEENVIRDKAKAASVLALKRAEAEGDKLKVIAGLSPLERAQIEKETAIGVAKALAGPEGIVFPKIVAGGQGPNGSSGALQTLELKMLNDLAKEMAKSKN